jgi:hypothetical protein
MNRLKNVSVASRTVYIVVIGVIILIALYAIFSSQLGQTALLVCCGGGLLLVVVGLASERGMRRPR